MSNLGCQIVDVKNATVCQIVDVKSRMSNLGLVSYNKKFLYYAVGAPGSTHDAVRAPGSTHDVVGAPGSTHDAVGAPGSTHDARMLLNSTIYQKIVTGLGIPDRVIDLGEDGKIP